MPVAPVNGSEDVVNGSEDEGVNHSFKYDSMNHQICSLPSVTRLFVCLLAFTGSPGKKSRLEPSENPSDTVDENEMEVQEGAKEQPQDADMDIGQDSFPPRSPHTPPPATSKGKTCKCLMLPLVFLTFSYQNDKIDLQHNSNFY